MGEIGGYCRHHLIVPLRSPCRWVAIGDVTDQLQGELAQICPDAARISALSGKFAKRIVRAAQAL
jgi:hypothetical protein